MPSNGFPDRSGSAASVLRNAARSARRAGERENASRSSRPASGSASTLIAIAIARLVNSRTAIGGVLTDHGQTDQQLSTEQGRHHHRPDERAQHVLAQRLAFVERVPDGHRDAEQGDVEPGGRQRQPAGHEPERNDQNRVAEREEQRGHDDEAHHRPRL